MSALELSVILCTHNPRADFLAETLAALRAQTLPFERWELVVVDNASEPPVACDLAWHPRARVVREGCVGLTKARLCGFRETVGAVLVFVDDDNLLSADYLRTVLAIAAAWPLLGAWGGRCVPRFEREPAEWTRKYWDLLGICELQHDRWSNVFGDNSPVPIGAGLCVRRNVAARYADYLALNPARATLDRAADRLLSCGDSDLALTSYDLGMGTGLFAALCVVHLIPGRRLEKSYLRELLHGINYSIVILRSFRGVAPSRMSRSQRLLKWWESIHLEPHDREFDAIVTRAREEALRDVPKFHPPTKR